MSKLKMFFSLNKIKVAVAIPAILVLGALLVKLLWEFVFKFIPIEWLSSLGSYAKYVLVGIVLFVVYLFVVYKLSYKDYRSLKEAHDYEHAALQIDVLMNDAHYRRMLSISKEYIPSKEEIREFLIDYYVCRNKEAVLLEYDKNGAYWAEVAKAFEDIQVHGIF